MKNARVTGTIDVDGEIVNFYYDFVSGTSYIENTIRGTSGDDELHGVLIYDRFAEYDEIFGYGGNDNIRGGSGNDTVYGDSGDDTIYGDSGNDNIRGGSGNDTIYGDYTYVRNDGDDLIFGDDGDDTIYDGYGDDTIYGGGGDDVIYIGGNRYDTIYGGDGLDAIVVQGNSSDYSLNFQSNIERGVISKFNFYKTYSDVERIEFEDRTLALDVDNGAGEIYRLYEAAFNRTPDDEGLTFWINVYDEGNLSLQDIAEYFIDSPEFETLYGNVDSLENSQYITYLYGNILDREPESSGFNYWVEKADEGLSFENILVYFSESAENVAAVGSQISNGIWYDYI